jgi:hypothetical protein
VDNRTTNEICNDLADEISTIRDPRTGIAVVIDKSRLSDSTYVWAVLINCIASRIYDLNQQLILLRQGFNPYYATGAILDDVIQYRNLKRKSGSPTTTLVTFGTTGNPVVVPAGTIVATEDESVQFVTTAEAIAGDGAQPVKASCTQNGDIFVDVNSLKKILPSIPGVAIDSNNTVIIGTNDETELELKKRLASTYGTAGYGYLYSIEGAVMNLDGVKFAAAYADNVGKLNVVVLGGDDTEVATAIYENSSFMTAYSGNTTVTVKTKYLDRDVAISFTRPTEEIIAIKITVVVLPDTTLSHDVMTQMILGEFSKKLQAYQPGGTVVAVDLAGVVTQFQDRFIVSEIKFGDDSIKKLDGDKYANTNLASLTVEWKDTNA